MRESHEELKGKARRWLEEIGYFVLEEVNIGNRRVDVLGIKFDSPEDIVGVECGKVIKKTSPEDIVIFHWPYRSLGPYRLEPVASEEKTLPMPKFDDYLFDKLLERGFYKEAKVLLATFTRAFNSKQARRNFRILLKAAKEKLRREGSGEAQFLY